MAVTHYQDYGVVARVSEGLGDAMVGIHCDDMWRSQKDSVQMSKRGE